MSLHEIQLKIEPSIPIRERVYQHLRNGILSGQIPQSTILIEARLAAQVGISRTPVREALHFLEKEGLLEALPRVGYRVREMDWSEIEEICEIRKVVEDSKRSIRFCAFGGNTVNGGRPSVEVNR